MALVFVVVRFAILALNRIRTYWSGAGYDASSAAQRDAPHRHTDLSLFGEAGGRRERKRAVVMMMSVVVCLYCVSICAAAAAYMSISIRIRFGTT